jgi:hypothetical protein
MGLLLSTPALQASPSLPTAGRQRGTEKHNVPPIKKYKIITKYNNRLINNAIDNSKC